MIGAIQSLALMGRPTVARHANDLAKVVQKLIRKANAPSPRAGCAGRQG
jgi:hypothetical protein